MMQENPPSLGPSCGQGVHTIWTSKILRDTVRELLGDRLFMVVSNREPYIHTFEGDQIVCQVPSGGLTAALDPVMRACGGLWIAHGSGNADQQVVDAQSHVQVPPEDPAYTLRRIWLDDREEQGYYYGFSNEGLWPLCHIAYTRPIFDMEDWSVYKAVNRKFADAVLQEVGNREAFVFIQDYHFALLSRMIRQPNIRSAQFWHIPWPNAEVFRICPWVEEIVDGLLGNDLLGFHTRVHCLNFLDTINGILEARVDFARSQVWRGGKRTQVLPFPISVDFDAISEFAASAAVEQEMRRLIRLHGLDHKIVGLGVDRIDYIKGIPERLRALNRFLERNPDMRGRFVFVQVASHSRQRIEAYRRVEEEIEDLIQQLNTRYQEADWKPVVFLDNVSTLSLQAWYRIADLCVVSSLHDGMNLAAKEFVASRVQRDGVLVISEFAGAANALHEALIVNPYNIDQLAKAIDQACRMPREEQQRRMERLRDIVHEFNIFHWAGKLLSALFELQFHKHDYTERT
jgi:trehalose 6-phosphate synthase